MSYFVIENLGTGKICSIIDNQCGKWGYDIKMQLLHHIGKNYRYKMTPATCGGCFIYVPKNGNCGHILVQK